jgi:transcriptional regulator with XRE-family HTH domain
MKGLGERIKQLRKTKGLTLVEVARKTGIDQATLSRIENEKMTGTLDSHMRIAGALGLGLPDLYQVAISKASESKDEKVRQKVETFSHSSGAVAELLTAGVLQKKMMPILLRIKGKGRTETEEFSPLAERFIYQLKGKVELHIDGQAKLLSAGDTLYFNAGRQHHFANPLSTESQTLSVMTPTSL